MRLRRLVERLGKVLRHLLSVILVGAVLTVTACTGQDPSDTPQPAPSPAPDWGPGVPCENYATAKIASKVLTGEEFLEGIHEDDVEVATAMLYPPDHPQAGDLVPLDEWQDEQVAAWGKYISRQYNLRLMMTAVYDQMIDEVSADDFMTTVHGDRHDRLSRLIYPPGHPQAGEFIPSSEWSREGGQRAAWEAYLITRPPDAGCPYGEKRFGDPS